MSGAEAWLWADFWCADATARDRMLAALAGAGMLGAEEHEAEAGMRVRAYWSLAPGPDGVRAQAEAAAAGAGVRFLAHGVQEREDWLAQWKAHFGPLRVTDRIWVCPPWDVREAAAEALIIVINPKMAFGTGHHATTQLCLQLLEANLRPGDTVLDVGTGSGILAIAAAKLGAERVFAVESDPEAARNAFQNVALNGVADRITLLEGRYPVGHLPPADVVVCNILTLKLLPLLTDLAAGPGHGATLIFSGIGAEHRGEFLAGLRAAGYALAQEGGRGEWCAFVTHASPPPDRLDPGA